MRCIRISEVARKVGGSVPTAWRLHQQDPTFPRSVKISPRMTVWVEAEIDEWLAGRVADSRRGVTPRTAVAVEAGRANKSVKSSAKK